MINKILEYSLRIYDRYITRKTIVLNSYFLRISDLECTVTQTFWLLLEIFGGSKKEGILLVVKVIIRSLIQILNS